MKLSSSAFAPGARIPARYTCEGADVSPPLAWTDAPVGTRSFAVFCDDPDAPGRTWHHWALFDIPSATDHLPEAHPKDAHVGPVRQAVNDFGATGYGGPCPPRGHGVHHYHFRLVALGVDRLAVGERPCCKDVEAAVQPHAIAKAELIGLYSR